MATTYVALYQPNSTIRIMSPQFIDTRIFFVKKLIITCLLIIALSSIFVGKQLIAASANTRNNKLIYMSDLIGIMLCNHISGHKLPLSRAIVDYDKNSKFFDKLKLIDKSDPEYILKIKNIADIAIQGNSVSAYVNLKNAKEKNQYILTIYLANEIDVNVNSLFYELNSLSNKHDTINEIHNNLLYSIKLWPEASSYYRHFLIFIEKYKYKFIIDDINIHFINDFNNTKSISVIFRNNA